MDKYYLVIDSHNDEKSKEKEEKKEKKDLLLKDNSKKLSDRIQSQYLSSPKTLKKIISNENFIKFQWAWVL